MSIEKMPDERVKIFYENIRQQVEAERGSNIASYPAAPFGNTPISYGTNL
jgi:hypothetical protein